VWREKLFGTPLLCTTKSNLTQEGELMRHTFRSKTILIGLLATFIGGTVQTQAKAAMVVNDGTTFRGQVTSLNPNNPVCTPTGPLTIVIHDNRVEFPWEGLKFHASLRDDGSFHETAGSPLGLSDKHMIVVPTLSGHISGGVLFADWGTRSCRLQMRAGMS
jgi:hypothetical protein